MKINKMLIAIPAMLAVVLSSCKDDDPTVGIDSSMPAPAEVSYDEMNSSSSSIGVYWDANAALKSGGDIFYGSNLKEKRCRRRCLRQYGLPYTSILRLSV